MTTPWDELAPAISDFLKSKGYKSGGRPEIGPDTGEPPNNFREFLVGPSDQEWNAEIQTYEGLRKLDIFFWPKKMG